MKDLHIMGNSHVRCVLNPPGDRSICSDCISSGRRSRAVDFIGRILAEKKGRISESRTGRYLVSTFEHPVEECKFFYKGFCTSTNDDCDVEMCVIAEKEDWMIVPMIA